MRKDKVMNKERLRVEKAVTIVLEHLEYIIDHRTTSDFVEVTGRMGDNVVTYRIYNDGSIYERWEYLDTECREGIIKIYKNFEVEQNGIYQSKNLMK